MSHDRVVVAVAAHERVVARHRVARIGDDLALEQRRKESLRPRLDDHRVGQPVHGALELGVVAGELGGRGGDTGGGRCLVHGLLVEDAQHHLARGHVQAEVAPELLLVHRDKPGHVVAGRVQDLARPPSAEVEQPLEQRFGGPRRRTREALRNVARPRGGCQQPAVGHVDGDFPRAEASHRREGAAIVGHGEQEPGYRIHVVVCSVTWWPSPLQHSNVTCTSRAGVADWFRRKLATRGRNATCGAARCTLRSCRLATAGGRSPIGLRSRRPGRRDLRTRSPRTGHAANMAADSRRNVCARLTAPCPGP